METTQIQSQSTKYEDLWYGPTKTEVQKFLDSIKDSKEDITVSSQFLSYLITFYLNVGKCSKKNNIEEIKNHEGYLTFLLDEMNLSEKDSSWLSTKIASPSVKHTYNVVSD